MNATPFARLEARVGSAIMARLANGYLVAEGSVAVPVVLSRPAIDGVLGGAGMQTRAVQGTVPAQQLGSHVQRGTPVAVFRDAQLQLLEGQYLVRQRDDDSDAGLARLDLELAPA